MTTASTNRGLFRNSKILPFFCASNPWNPPGFSCLFIYRQNDFVLRPLLASEIPIGGNLSGCASTGFGHVPSREAAGSGLLSGQFARNGRFGVRFHGEIQIPLRHGFFLQHATQIQAVPAGEFRAIRLRNQRIGYRHFTAHEFDFHPIGLFGEDRRYVDCRTQHHQACMNNNGNQQSSSINEKLMVFCAGLPTGYLVVFFSTRFVGAVAIDIRNAPACLAISITCTTSPCGTPLSARMMIKPSRCNFNSSINRPQRDFRGT